MPEHSGSQRRSAIPCDVTTGRTLPVSPSPDLFGYTPPAPSRPSRTAERTAPDRPPVRTADGTLAGRYRRAGARLRRSDGVALVVCVSHRGVRSSRDSGRYVQVATPGGGRPVYAGNLYGSGRGHADDLDGCQFQHGRGGTRYEIRHAGADGYAVAPVARRRGRASS